MKEHYISVDVETSGPIPGKYSLLTIGACSIEDSKKRFQISVKPLNFNAAPQALETTGLCLVELERIGVDPVVAMTRFEQWVTTTLSPQENPIFVGLNAPFDWSFINYYFHEYLDRNPFGISALDIKALFMGSTHCKWSDATSATMAQTLSPTRTGTHDALEDALYQAELFRLIRTELN